MKYIFANWKLYLNTEESRALGAQIADIDIDKNSMRVVVFPNALVMSDVRSMIDKTDTALGAQNINWAPQGAYTGALSATLYSEVGCSYALVGHSERRYIFGETNDAVRQKIEACLDAGLTSVLCVGETAEDREAGKEQYRIKKQLMKALDGLSLKDGEVCVAYEPVWAISQGGVGEQCSADHVLETVSLIKKEIATYTDAKIPVVYGGSVNADNVLSYASLDGVDGVLPGHASTQFESFSAIVRAVASL